MQGSLRAMDGHTARRATQTTRVSLGIMDNNTNILPHLFDDRDNATHRVALLVRRYTIALHCSSKISLAL